MQLDVNANYDDGYWLDVGNRLRQPSYVLVNANIGCWTEDSPACEIWNGNL